MERKEPPFGYSTTKMGDAPSLEIARRKVPSFVGGAPLGRLDVPRSGDTGMSVTLILRFFSRRSGFPKEPARNTRRIYPSSAMRSFTAISSRRFTASMISRRRKDSITSSASSSNFRITGSHDIGRVWNPS